MILCFKRENTKEKISQKSPWFLKKTTTKGMMTKGHENYGHPYKSIEILKVSQKEKQWTKGNIKSHLKSPKAFSWSKNILIQTMLRINKKQNHEEPGWLPHKKWYRKGMTGLFFWSKT